MFEGTYFGKNTFVEKESLFIFSDTLKENFFQRPKNGKNSLIQNEMKLKKKDEKL